MVTETFFVTNSSAGLKYRTVQSYLLVNIEITPSLRLHKTLKKRQKKSGLAFANPEIIIDYKSTLEFGLLRTLNCEWQAVLVLVTEAIR